MNCCLVSFWSEYCSINRCKLGYAFFVFPISELILHIDKLNIDWRSIWYRSAPWIRGTCLRSLSFYLSILKLYPVLRYNPNYLLNEFISVYKIIWAICSVPLNSRLCAVLWLALGLKNGVASPNCDNSVSLRK